MLFRSRADKLTLAALEGTLVLYLDPDRAARELPVLRMLRETPAEKPGVAGGTAGGPCYVGIDGGMIFVDGVDIGDPDDVALRDRRALSADGVFIVVATISSDDGSQVAPPEIIFRGVPFVEEADGLVEELREVVGESLAEAARHEEREATLLQQDLHDDIAAFVYERLRRRPMVLPVIVEV